MTLNQTLTRYLTEGFSEENSLFKLNAIGVSQNAKNQRKFQTQKPWYSHLMSARQRCRNPNASGFSHYGGRGIRCHLAPNEIQAIWERDKAHLLRSPSLDRIDSDKDYTKDNCRFIEQRDNCAKVAVDARKRRAAELKRIIAIKKTNRITWPEAVREFESEIMD